MDYESLTVQELRKIANAQNIGSGVWRAGASKADLISALSGGSPSDVSKPAVVAPVAMPANVSNQGAVESDSLAKILASALQSHLSPAPATLDESAIRALIADELSKRPNNRVDVHVNGAKSATIDGLQHKDFPALLAECALRNHVWLCGPAGSGKTTACENVAKALGLPFYFNGAIDTEYKLAGFIDAQGRYVSRPFRKAYECGGVYLWDEIDASLPSALLAFNAALANGQCDFPDAQVKKHPDFICVASANTWNGATSDYVGRFKLDGATLDRFAYLYWGYDEDLERAIVASMFPDNSVVADYVKRVQSIRSEAARHGVKHIVSPRASINGAKALASGIPLDVVLSRHVKKGLDNAAWEKIHTMKVGA